VNDRWTQGRVPGPALEAGIRLGGAAVQGLWRFLPDRFKELRTPPVPHADFTTPEYAQHAEIVEAKWEATRGVGHSFGANRHERPEDVITTTELVRSFVDIVAKNGNLLIGVGPDPDGTIPSWQAAPLLGLGAWLETNDEAIVGSRPWAVAGGRTSQGTEVRFTRRADQVYAVLLEAPPSRRFELRDIDARGLESVAVLGLDEAPEWEVIDGRLTVDLPDRLPPTPALTLRLGPETGVRPTGS
jgi:alpha-L-fucosidase